MEIILEIDDEEEEIEPPDSEDNYDDILNTDHRIVNDEGHD